MMPKGRVSNGRVKLKEANGVLSLTVPKNCEASVKHLIGRSFQCEVWGANAFIVGGRDQGAVIFSLIPSKKLQLRLRS
jgi:hypothetical protein